MTFVNPIFLYAFLLLPLAAAFLWWAQRRRERDLHRLGNPVLVQHLSSTVNRRGRLWKDALWLVVLAALLVALARPQWGSVTDRVEQEGIEVMVALDVSKSMLAQDLKPDRLSRAKMEIADLMERLGGDAIGLVLFSGASFVQFPLTSDYATARNFLDNARPEVISQPGTAIGDAIHTAMRGFDANRPSQKVIVLITDGEDHGRDALTMAKTAAEQGIRIYTFGLGSPSGEPIPEYDDRGQVAGYKKDQNGETVLSRLDESTLQRIAEAGNGRYYPATAGGSEIEALTKELSTLQGAELASVLEVRGIERFQFFLLLGLTALVAAELIPDRVVRGIRLKVAQNRMAMHGRPVAGSGR